MYTKNDKDQLRHSNGQMIVVTVPDVAALTRTVDASISTSTEITLNVATTILQVYAIAKDVYLKWGTADVTSSNFDEVIIAGTIQYFKVPNGQTAINLIEREAGATIIVIEK
jgi:hypothetical protein